MLQSILENGLNKMSSKKRGQTSARKDAMVSDAIKRIAQDNISHNEWCKYASEKYEITIRRAEQLWSDAWREIRDKFAQDAETNLLQAVARLDDLYSQASEQGGDWNTRNNILTSKHKLLGLYVDKQEHTVETKLSFDFGETEEK